jgi:transketolase
VLRECDGDPEAIVIATGSEVELAVAAAESMPSRRIRVVSMPSTDRFDQQDEAWRESVLPTGITRRVAVEAGVTAGWWKYVGSDGRVIGLDTYGASAPAGELFKHFDLTAERICRVLEELLA